MRRTSTSTPMSSTSSTPPAPERSLGDWLRLLRDGWPAFLVCVGLGTGGALYYTSRQKPTYGATSTLVVSSVRGFLDPQNADQLPALAETVGRLAVTTPVLRDTAIRYVGLASSPVMAAQRLRTATNKWVNNHTSALREASTAILLVSASAPTRRDASDLAEAAGRSLASVVNRTSSSKKGVPGGLKVTQFAVKPEGKTSPKPSRNLFIGLNAGILVGALAAFLLGRARRRLWGPEEIGDELQIPVLGTVRRLRKKRILVGPAFAALPDRLSERRTPGSASTILVSGVASGGRIVAVARSMMRTLEADGSHALLLDRDLQTLEEQTTGDSGHISSSGKGNVSAEQDAPGEHAAALSLAANVGGPGSPAIAPSTSIVAHPPIVHTREEPAADFVIIAGPPMGADEIAMSRLAKQADQVILVTERGASIRALRLVHEASPYLQRRLLGTIVVE
jgi:hypothetical protein